MSQESKVFAGAVTGIQGRLVPLEVYRQEGTANFAITTDTARSGRPLTPAETELRTRVTSALGASGITLPRGMLGVSFRGCPVSDLDRRMDLPAAVSLALALRQEDSRPERFLLLGELSLGGEVREVSGVLPLVEAAKAAGLDGVVVPLGNRHEAALVDGVQVLTARTLGDVLGHLSGGSVLPAHEEGPQEPATGEASADMADLPGLEREKEALEVAAAGGHGVLLVGPAGSCATALARRVVGILPLMSREERLETSRVWSTIGLLAGGLQERPFRAPHHTISDSGLIGGGPRARPGEASLAHNGVLFLDDLPEFRKLALDTLNRSALRDGAVTLANSLTTIQYPSNPLVIASMRPCPCGWNGVDGGNSLSCQCSLNSIESHWSRPYPFIKERLQVRIRMSRVRTQVEREANAPARPSSYYRERIEAARVRQQARFAGSPFRCNAELTMCVGRDFYRLSPEADAVYMAEVQKWINTTPYTALHILSLALTCADLEGHEQIEEADMRKAISLHSNPAEAA